MICSDLSKSLRWNLDLDEEDYNISSYKKINL